MHFRQRSLGAVLITWLSVTEGVPEARLSTGVRLRMSRCPRLDFDHSSDLSHEGQSHSLDTHFKHHQLLEDLAGAASAAAWVLPGDRDGAAPVPSAIFRLAPPGVSFLSSPLAWSGELPLLPEKGAVRGRAPPSSSV
jgi:hypothetical protein